MANFKHDGSAKKFTQEEKDFFVEFFTPVPEEGVLIWKKARNKYTEYLTGKEVGAPFNKSGYRRLTATINGKVRGFMLHRVLYWMVNNEEPDVLDHINRDKSDNRIENLRECTPIENHANRITKGDVSSGYTRVKRTSSGTYSSDITYDGEYHYLGVYKTAEEAYSAYKLKHVEFYGKHSPFHSEDIPSVKRINERGTYAERVKRGEEKRLAKAKQISESFKDRCSNFLNRDRTKSIT